MRTLEVVQNPNGKKFLWEFADGHTAESVYFLSTNATRQACISTQIGCNVGCDFCETGKQRSLRNLDPSEIVDQLRETISVSGVENEPLDAVSFAGMGEPLHNFDNVAEASEMIRREGLAKQIICFTSGIVPRIPLVADTAIDTLFVSLHATTNEVRTRLIPTNKKYPVEAVISASLDYHRRSGKRVWINYLLLKDINDTADDASRLCRLLDRSVFNVRLCHWNKVEERDFRCSDNGEAFLAELKANDYVATLEAPYREARDVGGGCGQLRSKAAR